MNTDNSLRLSCPKCNANVRVATKLSGKKIKCPKCASVIKVPGSERVGNDDDQWLSLDEPLKIPAASTSKSGSGDQKSPTKDLGGDADWLDDLPPLEPAGSGATGGLPPLSDADLRAISTAGGFAASPKGRVDPKGNVGPGGKAGGGDLLVDDDVPLPEVLTTADVVTEYRAKCPVCDSIHHVKPKQAGKEISCGDCFSRFIVPPPPKAVVKKKIDITKAASFGLAQVDADRANYEGPEARSAAEYLRAAEDSSDDDEDPHRQYENPDVKAWLRSMFGIFLDPSVLSYWLSLSFAGAIVGVISTFIPVVAFMTIGLIVMALMYISLIVACGFAIMESTAGGQKEVSEWPIFNPAEWFGQCFLALTAVAVSAFPGALIGYPVFGFSFATLATVLFSIFAMFPFVILSMMDNDSVFMPVSSEVTKSVTRCKESWGVLYFSSMLLFFGFFFLVAMLSIVPPAISVFVDCFLTVGLIFVYFSMVGGLAFQIGQSINHGEDSK